MFKLSEGPRYCAAVFLLCLSAIGRADTVTLSSVTGGWSNPTGDGVSTVTYQTVGGVSQIRWGIPFGSGGPQSGLGFDGVAPPDQVITIGSEFAIGTLYHYNNPIVGGTGLTGAKLTINMAFSDPSGLTGTFPFTFSINETPNTTGDPELDADHISFPSAFADQTITIDGTLYTLELLGFRQGSTTVSQFDSPEGATNSATLMGRITADFPDPSSAVPLPGVATAGLALMGGLGLRRGRRQGAAT